MENFVFPDEIDKTKLMKMNDKHFFMFPKIMQKCSKLYAFSLIIDLKTSGNALFYSHTTATWRLEIKLETTYKPPQGPCDLGKVQFFTFEPAILESIGDNHIV